MKLKAPRSGQPLPFDPADVERRRSLRRMRTIATGLLVVAAVVYFLTRDRDGAWGFVNAAAEASMVGAIADWFAVTALFRHPLGLPVPHTALIPKRKDELGKGLESFVGENFLQADVIRQRIAEATPSLRIGRWLAVRANSTKLAGEIATVAATGLSKVKDEHLETLIHDALFPRLRQEPIAPLAGGLLNDALADDLHRGLVDLGLTEMYEWLTENGPTVTDVLEERAPWWSPQRLNHGVATRVHQEILVWVSDIRADPNHRARQALDSWLKQLATSLEEDPGTQARAEAMKERWLVHPQVLASSVSITKALQRAAVDSLRDPHGALRERLATELGNFGQLLVDDAETRERLDTTVTDASVYLIERYGAEATAVITKTIESWDGREAAERIELHVGRDLQFIRINGTIVGGLVGLLIHTLSVLL